MSDDPKSCDLIQSKEYIDFVTDAQNPHVKYLILTTIERMKSINVAKLTIEIRDGKALFEMLPA